MFLHSADVPQMYSGARGVQARGGGEGECLEYLRIAPQFLGYLKNGVGTQSRGSVGVQHVHIHTAAGHLYTHTSVHTVQFCEQLHIINIFTSKVREKSLSPPKKHNSV